MAMSFSNTTLRVPHGFGNILEGLATEVLRDQPEDIPTFAAQYFTALLQKREESGLDPAEWGALMEHRFSSKDAVNQEICSPVKETKDSVTEDRIFQSDSYDHNEDKITQAVQDSSSSPGSLDASKDVVEPEPQPKKELNKSQDNSDETDSEHNLEFLYRGNADVDICAEELSKTEPAEEQMLESVQELDSTDEENETAVKELDPVTLSSYRGLADVDVCSEELQSTLQEHTEATGDVTVTDAGFIPPSESPDPVLVEQDVLHTHDKFILSDTEPSVYVEEDVEKELKIDISYKEQTIASPVKKDEIEEAGQLSEDVRETTNAGPEIHNVEQLHLNEGEESASVSAEAKTFDETNSDEIPLGVENQQANDILAAEAMNESSFTLEKASLAANEDRPGVEDLATVASEVQEENNDCESVTDAIAATNERDSQPDMKEDEANDDKQTDPNDIFEMIPVEEDMEGLEGINLNPTGFSAEDVNKDNTRTSQQDVDVVEDTSEVDKEKNSMNAPETQEDNLFYSTFTHESKGTLPAPTSDETEQGLEATYKQSASDSQEHTEEPDTATDYEESQHQEDSNLDQQEESSQPQEEEDIMDIPLDDPEANKAATKIQAGFRGHMTRKKLKPGDKPGEEVSSTGETLNGNQGDAGGSEGVETDETSVPEQ